MVSLQQIQRLEIMVTKLVEQLREIRKENHHLKSRVEELENINRESDSNAQKIEVGIQGVLDIISSAEEDEESPSVTAAIEQNEKNHEHQSNEVLESKTSFAHEVDDSQNTTNESPDISENSPKNASKEKTEDTLPTFSHPDDVPEEVDLDGSYTESNSQTEEKQSEFDIF